MNDRTGTIFYFLAIEFIMIFVIIILLHLCSGSLIKDVKKELNILLLEGVGIGISKCPDLYDDYDKELKELFNEISNFKLLTNPYKKYHYHCLYEEFRDYLIGLKKNSKVIIIYRGHGELIVDASANPIDFRFRTIGCCQSSLNCDYWYRQNSFNIMCDGMLGAFVHYANDKDILFIVDSCYSAFILNSIGMPKVNVITSDNQLKLSYSNILMPCIYKYFKDFRNRRVSGLIDYLKVCTNPKDSSDATFNLGYKLVKDFKI